MTDVITLFRGYIYQDIALPVAAMNALVVKIKVYFLLFC
jgi:hypothetical protein